MSFLHRGHANLYCSNFGICAATVSTLWWSWCGIFVWECPYTVCSQFLWWESWIWSEHGSYIFPGCAASWWEMRLEMEQLELWSSLTSGASSVQWPTPSYWSRGWVPCCWSISPELLAHAGSVPSKCVPSTSQHHHLHSKGEQCWSKRVWYRYLAWIMHGL